MDSEANTYQGTADVASSPSIRRTTYSESENPSAVVVELVAEVTGQSPTELDPLQYSVDADALNALFESASTQLLDVTFTYESVDVRVTNTGFVEVRP